MTKKDSRNDRKKIAGMTKESINLNYIKSTKKKG